MAEIGKYYQIEGEKATAENIDHVLTDLTEMLVDGPADPEKFAVIWEDSENETDRPHFKFGKSGEKTIIPGDDDRLIAADGQGNAKANSGYFYSKNESIENLSTAILQTSLPAMKLKIDGTTEEEAYWGNSHKGSLDMTWNAKVQFLGDAQQGSPVLSMADRSVIDLRGISSTNTADFGRNNRNSRNADWRSYTSYYVYQDMPSPFKTDYYMYNDGYVYPYLQMGESSTVIMREAALLQMRDGSSIVTSGNADVVIEGAGAKIEDDAFSYEKYGDTLLYLRPGCILSMQAGGAPEGMQGYGPLFMMHENGENQSQIFLTNQRLVNNHNNFSSLGVHNYKYEGTATPDDITLWQFSGRPYRFLRDKIGVNKDISKPSDSNNIIKPSICIQGRSNLVFGDNGVLGMRVAGDYNSETYINIESSGESYTCLRFGTGYGGRFVLDTTTNNNSDWTIKFGGGGSDTAQVVAIQPLCDTSINFNPNGTNGVFGVSCSPRCTDIVQQWNAFEGIFEGDQVFAQVEGNSHFEFWNDTKIIMRGDDIHVSLPTIVTDGPNIDITGTTSIDCTGYTIEQLMEVLNNNQLADLNSELKPTFSSSGKSNLTGGSATSTEYYEKRYRATAAPFVINKKSGTTSASNYIFYFTSSSNYSSTSAIENSTDFKKAVHNKYGENATVSNISWTKKATSYGLYYYYINADIANVTLTFNTTTNYTIGTTWADVAATDKTGLIAVDDSSSATITTVEVRPDMIYNTSISGYTYTTGTHLGEDWSTPVLATNGPVNQMFGSPNLCMRGQFSLGGQGTYSYKTAQVYDTYTIESPIETYDSTKTEKELIAQFIKGQDYAAFKTWVQTMIDTDLPLRDYYFDHISSFTINNGIITIGVAFEYKKLDKQTNTSPTVEFIGETELRIANGISITTDNVDGESTINIDAPEGSVSFTITQLKALKDLIVNSST